MNQEKRSLYQRIRNAKQSLENAEKSFLDDKGMRGELDLMLAEAELKNLRKKQTFPWSWNRNTLALSVAVLLFISGLGGWLFAKENLQKAEAVPPVVQPQQANAPVVANNPQTLDVPTTSNTKNVQQNIKTIVPTEKENTKRIQLTEKEMRTLVRSAKTELSSGK